MLDSGHKQPRFYATFYYLNSTTGRDSAFRGYRRQLPDQMGAAKMTFPCSFARTTFLASVVSMLIAAFAATASANLSIVPTYDSSIQGDTNAAAIEGVIQSALNVYNSRFSDPITISIKFQESSSSATLGTTSFELYTLDYSTLRLALQLDRTTTNDNVAFTTFPNTVNNPVTGTQKVLAKAANLDALNISHPPTQSRFDAIISLNMHITDVGSSDSSHAFSLMATVQHEVDEALGLGLQSPFNNELSPEDFFRYQITNNRPNPPTSTRSFTETNTSNVYFSIDGLTKLAQFDNQHYGGDYGDWQSNPLPVGTLAQVQDAFRSAGDSPTLGDNELNALDVIGYNLVAVPESSRAIKLALGMMGVVLAYSKVTRRERITRAST
jgi:hypothetical protein